MQAPLPSVDNPVATRKRLLLVDDHAILRQGLASVLNQQTHLMVCGEANDPIEALSLAERLQPDLALVDLSLRSGDGVELLKDLRVRQPRMLTLVLSMHDEALYAERALRAGARGYVMKQEKLDRLLLAISRVLAGAIYVSDQVAAHAVERLAVSAAPGGQESPKLLDSYVERLTDRELQVFRLIGRGLGTRLIADNLHLSRKTIESHREHIKTKLGLRDGSELVQRAILWAKDAPGDVDL
jgi:DNA-binding NarL/FixJ family response regulator